MRHRTLPALLTAQAARFGERMLFRSGASAWSYAQAPLVAATSAGRLAALGLRRGDRMGILAANSAELMAVLLGCLWSGVIAVPINTQAKAPQIRHIVDLAGIRVLIADAGLRAEVDADVVVHDIAARPISHGRMPPTWRPATPRPFCSPPAPPACQRVSAARRRSWSGGAPTPRTCSRSPPMTRCARPCRCSTSMR
jgi:crotonobetaine/carnitine-CoA ligase